MRRRKHVTVRIADLEALWHQQDGKCYYCGGPMNFTGGKRTARTVSVDRIDSSAGYDLDNIVLACTACNIGKGEMTTQEFIAHCAAVVEHQNKEPVA